VDAPDLPPEECEFFITSAGIADSDQAEIPKSKEIDFQIETLYEESNINQEEEGESNIKAEQSDESDLTNVKGIGKGTAENLMNYGISSISQLIESDPEEVASILV